MVSNVTGGDGNRSTNSVSIYDSNRAATVSLGLEKLICSFVKPRSDVYIFDIMNIQGQPNGNDCGLYAIACAAELVTGHDPVLCQWDCKQMRSHLLRCLEAGRIDRFPTTKQRRIPLGSRVRISEKETLYCICQMPNDKRQEMTECCRCFLWYHNTCVGLTQCKETLKDLHWSCPLCTDVINMATS